jgi:hypothetical protein
LNGATEENHTTLFMTASQMRFKLDSQKHGYKFPCTNKEKLKELYPNIITTTTAAATTAIAIAIFTATAATTTTTTTTLTNFLT